jgi:predicted Zn-dependent peptidase
VFHVHAPCRSGEGEPMLPAVLDALVDIAFAPQFLDTRVEKERRAVLAEAQMMNTIEYRVDCQLLAHLHWENALGCRFPIGLPEQITEWPTSALRAFHGRWYFPANATLYLVGDFEGGADAAVAAATAAFSPVAAPWDAITGAPRARHRFRPPVKHVYGVPEHITPAAIVAMGSLPGERMTGEATVRVFQHELLQQFTLSLFCKLPAAACRTHAELRRVFAVRILLSVLQFRASSAAAADGCPFVSLELDHSDSGREGCAVSTLTVVAEPADWAPAVRAACAEARRLARAGITPGELSRYAAAMLRDSEQLAGQSGSVPSLDNLDFVMESDALGHTVMDQVQGHDALRAVAASVTLADVNAAAAEVLGYIADYGQPDAGRDARGGRATAIVACVPTHMAVPRSDADVADDVAAPAEDGAEEEEGELLVPFEVSAEAIQAVLAEVGDADIAATEVHVPDRLVEAAAIEALVASQRPSYVLLDGSAPPAGWAPPDADAASGIAQRRLSNGIRVNWRRSVNEPQGAVLRLVAPGGRASERQPGAVALGARALSESGTAGDWPREQVELFCVSRLVNCALEADEEFLSLDCHCAVNEHGLRSAFEILHLMLSAPRWEDSALARAKAMYVTHVRALPKSLERATAARLMGAMTANDRRFLDPSEAEIAAVTLDAARDAVAAQLSCGALELSCVGDFDPEELDALVLAYLGTVRIPGPVDSASVAPALPTPVEAPVVVAALPAGHALRAQRLHLRDSDERACAYCAGPAPNRWGWGAASAEAAAAAYTAAGGSAAADAPSGGAAPNAPPELADAAVRRAHPLFLAASMALLAEVVNSRLFTTVRDALGLTYDVSFELSGFDRLSAGWFLLSVTSTPAKIDEALAASVRTLRSVGASRVTPRELDRARRTLLTRHESDLKDNAYVLGLLTHTQAPAVPAKSAGAIPDLPGLYMAATVSDIYVAFASLKLGPEHVFTCVGTAGTTAVPARVTAPVAPAAPVGGVLPPGELPAPEGLEAAVAALAGSDILEALQQRYRAAGGGGAGGDAEAR